MARKKPRKNKPSTKPRKKRVENRGRPIEFTTPNIIAALKLRKGLISLAAESLGCSAQCIYDRAKVEPEIASAIKDSREKMIDFTEEKLFECIEIRESWAIALLLKTLGKDRGYVERKETRHGGDETAPPIKTQTDANLVIINPSDLPLELRRKIVQEYESKQQAASDNKGESEGKQ